MSKEVPGQNRGFGFLEFYNHTCANAAKGVLSAPSYKCAPPARRPARRRSPLNRCRGLLLLAQAPVRSGLIITNAQGRAQHAR